MGLDRFDKRSFEASATSWQDAPTRKIGLGRLVVNGNAGAVVAIAAPALAGAPWWSLHLVVRSTDPQVEVRVNGVAFAETPEGGGYLEIPMILDGDAVTLISATAVASSVLGAQTVPFLDFADSV